MGWLRNRVLYLFGRLRGPWSGLLALGVALLLVALPAAGQRRLLPPPVPRTSLGSAWLWLDASTGALRPFVAGATPAQRVLYHYLPRRTRPTDSAVWVRARGGQCFFINNRLIFKAPVSGAYRLNVVAAYPRQPAGALLAIWHPSAPADPGIFLRADQRTLPQRQVAAGRPVLRPRLAAHNNRNVFIITLLLIGLFYGVLRSTFGVSLSRFLRLELATRHGGDVRLAAGNLPNTWLTLLFGFGFALSFALLIVVVQSNFESAFVLRNLFPLSDADILLRIGLYTVLVGAFILLRYLFLSVVGYVFDLTALVGIQYTTFVRTLLLAGAYIPLTVLLHMALSDVAPTVALRVSNLLLALLLVAVVIRAIVALSPRYPLSNPHLFAYLCATEVIPLLVLFRLIVTPLF